MKTYKCIFTFCLFFCAAKLSVAQNKYQLFIKGADAVSDSVILANKLTPSFSSQLVCAEYISKLPSFFKTRGFVTVSIDSLRYDSAAAQMVLFTGQPYKWVNLRTNKIENSLLEKINWRNKTFESKPVDFALLQNLQKKLIEYLGNNGYPFAKVSLDSTTFNSEGVSASLMLDKGFYYKIDSIRNKGKAKVSPVFLHKYLNIVENEQYNQEKIAIAKKKIRELSYVEEEKPAEITFLPSGSTINFFLRPRKSSQVNVLIGFLPRQDIADPTSTKILVTGEANVLLKNAFAKGETVGLNWQQIQQNSPRLNLLFNQPFIFNSSVGLDFSFDMFKKDSSFLNVNFQIGAQYNLSAYKSGKVFLQRFQTIVSQESIDTNLLIQTKQLPTTADVQMFNVGVDYEYNNTDYRLNPRKGNELRLVTSIGSKKIKKSNIIQNLKDPGNPSFNFSSLYDTIKLNTYQLRMRLTAAHFFPLPNKRSTIKTAINAGVLQSGNFFRNELFQIGGYKLLRGFDEESQYLSAFGIATTEFRYLVGQNSYFYVLADGGWGRDATVKNNYIYFGTGLGMLFETKAGIFNLAWAVGKRNDTNFNLRQSKIHFGFVNYF